MKNINILLVSLCSFILFTGCYTNVIGDGTEPNTNSKPEVKEISINCKLDFGENSTEGLKASTSIDEKELVGSEFKISSLSGEVPMSVFITDESDNIIMVSRELHSEGKNIVIDAISTSISLVTMHIALLPAVGQDYETIVGYIQEMPSFSDLVAKVQISIDKREDVCNEDNTELLIALNNTLDELYNKIIGDTSSEQIMQVGSQDDSKTRAGGINMDEYPLHILLYDDYLTFQTTGLAPTYIGEYTRIGSDFSIQKVGDLKVPRRSDYGILDGFSWLLNRGNSTSRLTYGEIEMAYLNNNGEYSFSLDIDKVEAYKHFLNYLLGTFLPDFDEDLKSEIAELVINSVPDLYQQIVLREISLENAFKEIIDKIQTIARGLTGKKVSFLKSFMKYFNICSRIKNSLNGLSYSYYFLDAPSHISFKLCHQENITEDCTTAEIRIVKGDNQTGEAGQRLLEPLAIEYTSYNAMGEEIHTADGKDVKFVVTSGNGRVSEHLVHAVANQASVWWTLGDGEPGDIQNVEAYVVSSLNPDVIISNTVVFSASIKAPQDVKVRLDWTKVGGKTDIDLHVVDPYGEEIYYLHPFSESGGWLDRDDQVGPGPEHISWNVAPAGTYKVKVHYYDSESMAITNYTVTISANGETKTYKGSIAYHQEVSVASFIIPSTRAVDTRSDGLMIQELFDVEDNKIYPKKNKE